MVDLLTGQYPRLLVGTELAAVFDESVRGVTENCLCSHAAYSLPLSFSSTAAENNYELHARYSHEDSVVADAFFNVCHFCLHVYGTSHFEQLPSSRQRRGPYAIQLLQTLVSILYRSGRVSKQVPGGSSWSTE